MVYGFADKCIEKASGRVKTDYAFFTHYEIGLITSCL